MPTNKLSNYNIDSDFKRMTKNDDDIEYTTNTNVDMNMDETMLRLIFDRMLYMSNDNQYDSISRNELLERMF